MSSGTVGGSRNQGLCTAEALRRGGPGLEELIRECQDRNEHLMNLLAEAQGMLCVAQEGMNADIKELRAAVQLPSARRPAWQTWAHTVGTAFISSLLLAGVSYLGQKVMQKADNKPRQNRV